MLAKNLFRPDISKQTGDAMQSIQMKMLEVFGLPSDYNLAQLGDITPGVRDDLVAVRRFRVTIEEIVEPADVLRERVKALLTKKGLTENDRRLLLDEFERINAEEAAGQADVKNLPSYEERCKQAKVTDAGDIWVNIKTGRRATVTSRRGFQVGLKHESGRETSKQDHYLAGDFYLFKKMPPEPIHHSRPVSHRQGSTC